MLLKNKTFLVHLALFTVSLIYGANYTIAKEVMPMYLSPAATILVRIAGAGLLFWMIIGNKPLKLANRKEKIRLLLSAFFGIFANQLLFFEGLARTTPINASLIMTTTPLLVLIVSAVSGGERLTFLKSLGVGFGLVGAAMLISGKSSTTALSFSFSLGDLLVLLNATSYAIYLVIAKPLLQKHSALDISKWIFTLALPMILPFAWDGIVAVEWSQIPFWIYAALGYVVLCTTFLAYLLNAWALRSVSSSTVGIYIYLQPVLATLIAVSVDKDTLTLSKIAWASFIFIGVFLVSYQVKKKKGE